MFYVNDIDGLKFKGPLEKLEKWRSVIRKASSTPLEGDGNVSNFAKGPGAHAVAAYQKIISNNNIVEPLVHVYQIMSSPPTTILPDTPLTEAWWLLQKLNIRQAIVTTENRRIIGMLSERDILKRITVIEDEAKIDPELLVNDVIKKEFVSTDSISDIRRVAKALANLHINAMPVLDDERLSGIVTRGDILRGFAMNPKLNLWA